MTDYIPAAKLPWITPRLEPIGGMDDVRTELQPNMDGMTSPEIAAS